MALLTRAMSVAPNSCAPLVDTVIFCTWSTCATAWVGWACGIHQGRRRRQQRRRVKFSLQLPVTPGKLVGPTVH